MDGTRTLIDYRESELCVVQFNVNGDNGDLICIDHDEMVRLG